MSGAADRAQRDRLISDNLSYVRALAVGLRQQVASHVSVDELEAYGQRGLVEAAERFDPTRGAAFRTFAYYRIRGAMFDGLREQGWLRRDRGARFASGANAYLQNQADRGEPAAEQGSRSTEGELERIAATLNDVATIFLTSFSAPGDPEPVDQEARDGAQIAEERETGVVVREALQRLPDRERRLLELCYYQDQTIAAAGRELGLSKSWSSRLHARAVRLLARELDASAGLEALA